jgi:hypothetical protein
MIWLLADPRQDRLVNSPTFRAIKTAPRQSQLSWSVAGGGVTAGAERGFRQPELDRATTQHVIRCNTNQHRHADGQLLSQPYPQANIIPARMVAQQRA